LGGVASWRKWLMSKLAPKKYGDRLTNEHAGREGGPIQLRSVDDAVTAAGLIQIGWPCV